jgi:hypothetical protein
MAANTSSSSSSSNQLAGKKSAWAEEQPNQSHSKLAAEPSANTGVYDFFLVDFRLINF